MSCLKAADEVRDVEAAFKRAITTRHATGRNVGSLLQGLDYVYEAKFAARDDKCARAAKLLKRAWAHLKG